MGRKTGEAQAPVAELQAPLSVPHSPEGIWRWAQETPQVISEESKRTRKMPEYWRPANSILIFKRQEKQILLTTRLESLPPTSTRTEAASLARQTSESAGKDTRRRGKQLSRKTGRGQAQAAH